MSLLSLLSEPPPAGDHALVVATDWLVVATAVLAAGTLVIAGLAFLAKKQVLAQLRIGNKQTKQSRNEQLHVRARETMEAIRRWREVSEPLYVELGDKYVAKHGSMEAAVREETEKAFNRGVRRILEHVELLALGVRTKAYDDHLVYELSRGWITTAWNTFSPYIKRRRAEADLPSMYEHFEWLVNHLAEMAPPTMTDRPLPGELPDPAADDDSAGDERTGARFPWLPLTRRRL